MIDLHCHVLPGLDDGPDRMAASVEMMLALEADGIERVAATPHLRAADPRVTAMELRERCEDLEDAARAAGCGVRIESGAELSLDWALQAAPADLRRASFGGRGTDLLIEVPHGRLPKRFEDDVEAVIRAGYRVVLAHPEVNADLQRAPERLLRLVDAGALLQVTARALVRGGGKTPSAALARDLVRAELCHVLATDAHSAGPWRAPDLRRGVLEAARLAGARAEWMVSEAPAAILEGEPLPRPPRSDSSVPGLAYLRRHATA